MFRSAVNFKAAVEQISMATRIYLPSKFIEEAQAKFFLVSLKLNVTLILGCRSH